MSIWPEYRISKREIDLSPQNPYCVAFCSPDHKDYYVGDIHYALQICIVLKGEFTVLYPDSGNFVRRLEEGQFFLSSVWEAHAIKENIHPSSLLALSFSVENIGAPGVEDADLNWLAPFSPHPSRRPFGKDAKSRTRMLDLSARIMALHKEKPFAHKTRIWLKILEMLIPLVEESRSQEKMGGRGDAGRIMPAILMVQKAGPHYPSLEECAAACGLSRSRFSCVFTSSMGFSFGKFLTRSKMSRAARLVKNTSMSFKEIAQECGFQDVVAFYHAFSERFKCPPGAFRDQRGALKGRITSARDANPRQM